MEEIEKRIKELDKKKEEAEREREYRDIMKGYAERHKAHEERMKGYRENEEERQRVREVQNEKADEEFQIFKQEVIHGSTASSLLLLFGARSVKGLAGHLKME